jgi:hypothetical protein
VLALHLKVEGGFVTTDFKPTLFRNACELYDVVVEIKCTAVGSKLIRRRIVMRIARVETDYSRHLAISRRGGIRGERLS